LKKNEGGKYKPEANIETTESLVFSLQAERRSHPSYNNVMSFVIKSKKDLMLWGKLDKQAWMSCGSVSNLLDHSYAQSIEPEEDGEFYNLHNFSQRNTTCENCCNVGSQNFVVRSSALRCRISALMLSHTELVKVRVMPSQCFYCLF
jgi:hypothetical protein